MRVLSIGNSFSQDATRYLWEIARCGGADITTVNIVYPGCSLEQHYRYMLSGEKKYSLEFNGRFTGFYVSLTDALLSGHWDVITVQQASHVSFSEKSYYPYINALTEYIRKCAPGVKLLVHETWEYANGSTQLANVTPYSSSAEMRRDIISAYESAARNICADGIIRSGELIGKLTDKGMIQIHRDGFHLSLGKARYAVALLWFRTLTGKSVGSNGFCVFDVPVSEDDVSLIKETVDGMDASAVIS